jgi:hypothetical protein
VVILQSKRGGYPAIQWHGGFLKLESVLFAVTVAGHEQASSDYTLIETDRCGTSGPTTGVVLWWPGKNAALGDLGHEGEASAGTGDLTTPQRGQLTDEQKHTATGTHMVSDSEPSAQDDVHDVTQRQLPRT